MRNSKVKIVVGVTGFYLFAAAELVGIAGFPEQPGAAGASQARRLDSDLQTDEVSLTRDTGMLRRDLKRAGNEVAVAKARNLVLQDILNIVLDRMQPAQEVRDLDRDQDQASLTGESFAAPAQKLIHDFEPAERS